MRTQFTELSDCQWQVISSIVPTQKTKKLCLRKVLDAMLFITSSGVQWRNLPPHYPKWQKVYYHFRNWQNRQAILVGKWI